MHLFQRGREFSDAGFSQQQRDRLAALFDDSKARNAKMAKAMEDANVVRCAFQLRHREHFSQAPTKEGSTGPPSTRGDASTTGTDVEGGMGGNKDGSEGGGLSPSARGTPIQAKGASLKKGGLFGSGKKTPGGSPAGDKQGSSSPAKKSTRKSVNFGGKSSRDASSKGFNMGDVFSLTPKRNAKKDPAKDLVKKQLDQYEEWMKLKAKNAQKDSSDEESDEEMMDPNDIEAFERKQKKEEKRKRKNWKNCTPTGGRFGRDEYVEGGRHRPATAVKTPRWMGRGKTAVGRRPTTAPTSEMTDLEKWSSRVNAAKKQPAYFLSSYAHYLQNTPLSDLRGVYLQGSMTRQLMMRARREAHYAQESRDNGINLNPVWRSLNKADCMRFLMRHKTKRLAWERKRLRGDVEKYYSPGLMADFEEAIQKIQKALLESHLKNTGAHTAANAVLTASLATVQMAGGRKNAQKKSLGTLFAAGGAAAFFAALDQDKRQAKSGQKMINDGEGEDICGFKFPTEYREELLIWYGRLVKALLVIEFSTINADSYNADINAADSRSGSHAKSGRSGSTGDAGADGAVTRAGSSSKDPPPETPSGASSKEKKSKEKAAAKAAKIGEDQLMDVLDIVDMHFGGREYNATVTRDIFKDSIVRKEQDGTFSLRYKSTPQKLMEKKTRSWKEPVVKVQPTKADLIRMKEANRQKRMNQLLDCRMGLQPPKLKGFGVPLYYKIPGDEPPDPRELPIPLHDAALFNQIGAEAYFAAQTDVNADKTVSWLRTRHSGRNCDYVTMTPDEARMQKITVGPPVAWSAHMHTAGSFHYMDFLWQVMERHDIDLKAKKDLIRLVAHQRRDEKKQIKDPSLFSPFGERSRGLTIADIHLYPHPSFKLQQEYSGAGGSSTGGSTTAGNSGVLDVSGRAPTARMGDGDEVYLLAETFSKISQEGVAYGVGTAGAKMMESREALSRLISTSDADSDDRNATSGAMKSTSFAAAPVSVVDPKTIYADVRRIQREMELLFRCKYELTGIKDYVKQLQVVTRGGMQMDEVMSIDDFVAAARERRYEHDAGDNSADVPMDVAVLAVGKYSHSRPGTQANAMAMNVGCGGG